MFGGFVYLDDSGSVKAVMALAIGDGLEFKASAPWKREYSGALAGRWQPVTAPLLKARGVKRYAWINPNETLKGDEGAPDWTCISLFIMVTKTQQHRRRRWGASRNSYPR